MLYLIQHDFNKPKICEPREKMWNWNKIPMHNDAKWYSFKKNQHNSIYCMFYPGTVQNCLIKISPGDKLITAHSLTHWGRVTHICVSKLTTMGSDNGLSPGRRQAIIWPNDGILLIRTLGTNFSEILSEIHSFSFKKMHLKMSFAKWCIFRLGLNELNTTNCVIDSCQLGYFRV